MNKTNSKISSLGICIESLQLNLHIGVEEWERSEKQKVFISLRLQPNYILSAAYSDNISETINYHTLSLRIKELETKEYKLIEKLASDVFSVVSLFLSKEYKITGKCNIEICIQKYPKVESFTDGVQCILKGEVTI